MRLSRTNMPLASSDSVISQLTYAAFLDNLAPHLRAENPDHKLFCHSQPQNPPQLSKSGNRSKELNVDLMYLDLAVGVESVDRSGGYHPPGYLIASKRQSGIKFHSKFRR